MPGAQHLLNQEGIRLFIRTVDAKGCRAAEREDAKGAAWFRRSNGVAAKALLVHMAHLSGGQDLPKRMGRTPADLRVDRPREVRFGLPFRDGQREEEREQEQRERDRGGQHSSHEANFIRRR